MSSLVLGTTDLVLGLGGTGSYAPESNSVLLDLKGKVSPPALFQTFVGFLEEQKIVWYHLRGELSLGFLGQMGFYD